MIAKWRANVILGLSAFLFTYFLSLVNNTWKTSLIRASIGFLLFFILAYIVRLVLYQIGSNKNSCLNLDEKKVEGSNPDAESKNHLEEVSSGESSFHALPLHSLHNGTEANDPEKIANTIRTWTTQNQEG
jgi:hypothetical protein